MVASRHVHTNHTGVGELVLVRRHHAEHERSVQSVVEKRAVAHEQQTQGSDLEGKRFSFVQGLHAVGHGIVLVWVVRLESGIEEGVGFRSFDDTPSGDAGIGVQHRRLVHIHDVHRDVCRILLSKRVRHEHRECVQRGGFVVHGLLKRDDARAVVDAEDRRRTWIHHLEEERRREYARDAQQRKQRNANRSRLGDGVRSVVQREGLRPRGVEGHDHQNRVGQVVGVADGHVQRVRQEGVQIRVMDANLTQRVNTERLLGERVREVVVVSIHGSNGISHVVEQPNGVLTDSVEHAIGEEGSVIDVRQMNHHHVLIEQTTSVGDSNTQHPLRLQTIGEELGVVELNHT